MEPSKFGKTTKRSSGAASKSYLPAVDKYVASAPAFAQPILTHVRKLIHKTLPEIEEAIKWGHPFFMYGGLMLGNMAAFKQHCSLGLWGSDVAEELRADGVYDRAAMGVLGKLTSAKDLPSDRELANYFRTAAAAIDTGARTMNYSRPKPDAPKPPPQVPLALTAALKKNKTAASSFLRCRWGRGASTASGSQSRNEMRHATNASLRPLSGSPKANAVTGSMRTADATGARTITTRLFIRLTTQPSEHFLIA